MCRYISARKKLIHAMSLDIDQAINRPMVVGCAISATRNYLKLQVLLCNTHAETRKLWKRSARFARYDWLRPPATIDRDHPFRAIATSLWTGVMEAVG
jgi:hypothetical protein